jgi:2-phosphosulfolactate phosphatase
MHEETAGRALTVDVALVPSLVRATHHRHARTVYVVVDVIRATTTLCVLFERGCRRVLVASDIAAARRARAQWHPQALLAGEVGGAMPPGFDLGNSPGQLGEYDVRGLDVLFATTNGTRALYACQGGGTILAGALRNARAVAAASVRAARRLAASVVDPEADAPLWGETAAAEALSPGASDIVVVCSGSDGLPAYDDAVCAGYLVERIVEQAALASRETMLESGAQIVHAVVRQALAEGPLYEALAGSHAARSLEHVGLFADVGWCAEVDATSLVPTVTGLVGELPLIEPRW